MSKNILSQYFCCFSKIDERRTHASSKGSLFFVFLGVRDQKGGEHGEQVGEEERGIYSKPGKGE